MRSSAFCSDCLDACISNSTTGRARGSTAARQALQTSKQCRRSSSVSTGHLNLYCKVNMCLITSMGSCGMRLGAAGALRPSWTEGPSIDTSSKTDSRVQGQGRAGQGLSKTLCCSCWDHDEDGG